MSNKLIKYKFRNESFAGYGLNKFKNFMQAPKCDCGCGGDCKIILKETNDLFGFMNQVLMDNECDCCAIFAHTYDEKMYAAIKCIYEGKEVNEDETIVDFFGVDNDLEFFQEIDAKIGLHCYGLMIETEKGKWKVIEN